MNSESLAYENGVNQPKRRQTTRTLPNERYDGNDSAKLPDLELLSTSLHVMRASRRRRRHSAICSPATEVGAGIQRLRAAEATTPSRLGESARPEQALRDLRSPSRQWLAILAGLNVPQVR